MTINERIKYLRIKKQMTQDELAKKVGFNSRSSVNKIEHCTRGLNQSTIAAFATALETTPTFLLFGDIPDADACQDGRITEFALMFSQLTNEQKDFILAAIKGLLEHGEGNE